MQSPSAPLFPLSFSLCVHPMDRFTYAATIYSYTSLIGRCLWTNLVEAGNEILNRSGENLGCVKRPARQYQDFIRRLPMFQPQDLSILTTLGVTAAANGTLTKMKLL
jgi:hypothetical protein